VRSGIDVVPSSFARLSSGLLPNSSTCSRLLAVGSRQRGMSTCTMVGVKTSQG